MVDASHIDRIAERTEHSFVVRTIRVGLVRAIPVLMIGAFSLLLLTLPIPAYLDFIKNVFSGVLYETLLMVHNATFGMLSLYMLVSISYSCSMNLEAGPVYAVGGIIASLVNFAIFSGVLSEGFDIGSFGSKGSFLAIFCSIATTYLYIRLCPLFFGRKIYTDGADGVFNSAFFSILPMSIVALGAAGINLFITHCFHVSNLQELFINTANNAFNSIESPFVCAFLFVLMTNLLWFFGIHGGDVLDGVSEHVFLPRTELNAAAVAAGGQAGEIFTKEFFDIFVFMGGCGSLMCLLIALLIVGKHSSTKRLTRLAVFPVVFNINEPLVFGLPIVFKPLFLIPFLATPLVCVAISYAAMSLGLVPMTISDATWTTPVLLGGYISTGSIAGSILQLVNLTVGTCLYLPFVRLYDKQKYLRGQGSLKSLVTLLQEHEASGSTVTLTEQHGDLGATAKTLVTDLRLMMNNDEIELWLQPQYDRYKTCIGAEALLRCRHPSLGMLYPPLVIKLAQEEKFIFELERRIVAKGVEYLEEMKDFMPESFILSVNATVPTLRNPEFLPFLSTLLEEHPLARGRLCLEITEQNALNMDDATETALDAIRSLGVGLAVDDFSMGSTSLKYLQGAHIDCVKLDGSLVKNMGTSSTRMIIESITHLAGAMGFLVLAEYVETDEQMQTLLKLGCCHYQGYLFSPAVPAEDFFRMLSETGRMAAVAGGVE